MTHELLRSLVVNTKPTPSAEISSELAAEKADIHMAYKEQHPFDGYAQIVDHAHRRKAALDKKVMTHLPREVMATWSKCT